MIAAQSPVAVDLVRRAACYALATLDEVSPPLLSRPTPCREWDLRMLLVHASESVSAIDEGIVGGRVALYPAEWVDTDDPTAGFRASVSHLLADWVHPERCPYVIEIADHVIAAPALAGVAAVELAVHGWDISQAIGQRRPIPPDLAADLLAVSEHLLPDTNRQPLFADPVTVSASAGSSERLLAYLGRAS